MTARRWFIVAGAVAALAAGGLSIGARNTEPSSAVTATAVAEPYVAPRVTPSLEARTELARWTMSTLDEIFHDEARDDAWAAAREAEIRSVKTDERLAGVTSIDAECRRSMCRIVVGLDPTTARRTLHALTVTPPLNTTGFHGVDPDDNQKLRLFVSKEGTSLMEHPALVAALQARTRG